MEANRNVGNYIKHKKNKSFLLWVVKCRNNLCKEVKFLSLETVKTQQHISEPAAVADPASSNGIGLDNLQFPFDLTVSVIYLNNPLKE